MGELIYPGTCSLCGKTFSRRSMGRHLESCGLTAGGPLAATAPAKLCDPRFHLFIDARYAPDYWLHLAVPAEETLGSLDGFLREIWVECCEHLSAFTIEGRQYAENPEESEMDVPLGRVLQPGMVFKYEYDFGSTTELRLKVVGFWDRQGEGGAIELLARNDAPQVACDECGKHNATQICTDCQCEGAGWLCDDCADLHECGSERLLPVVNSPRTGVCRYCG